MKNMKKSMQAGFTLIEMVVALSISSVVLIGTFYMLSTMMQFEVEGLRKGSVNAWSLASLVAMNGEIEGATVLVYPPTGSLGQDAMMVCSNWSRMMGVSGGAGSAMNSFGPPPGGIDTTGAGTIGKGPTIYTYCFDSLNNVMRRKAAAGNCPAVGSPGATPAACTAANYGADSVVATGVYKDGAGDPIFTPDLNYDGSVRTRYVVGKASAGAAANEGNGTTSFTNPVTMAFDTRLTLSKSVNIANTFD